MDGTTGALLCESSTGGNVQQCVTTFNQAQTVEYLVDSTDPGGASSVNISEIIPGALASYLYDTAATHFFFVEMQTNLTGTPIRPNPQSTGVPIANAHYHEYQYILETDDAGNVIGGEWASGSKYDHPNFAWSPTETPLDFGGGLVKYSEAKSLLNESLGLTTNHTSRLVNPLVLSRVGGMRPLLATPPGWIAPAPTLIY